MREKKKKARNSKKTEHRQNENEREFEKMYEESACEKKTDRTPEEEDMLDMMLHGGERVKIQNLQGVISWYNGKR